VSRQAAIALATPRFGPDYSRVFASREATEYVYAGVAGEVRHPSTTIRLHSERGEKVGEAFERIINSSATLGGLIEKRVKAVTGLPWNLVPGDESDEARRIADLTTWMLWDIEKLEINLSHQLGGIPRGCAFEEMVWEPRTTGRLAGLWAVNELIDRPMSRFGFKEVAGRPNTLCVRRKDGQLDPVPPGRILHFCHGTKDNPWGLALLDKVYWFQWASLHFWKYACVAGEKYAQPNVIVTYERPSGDPTSEEHRAATAELASEALDLAYTYQTEQAMAMPKDIELMLKEAQRSGVLDYSTLLQLLDRAMALVFLGEVDTSGMSQGPGSFAKNRISNEVRYETILADARAAENTISEGLIVPFVRVNFGPEAPVPYFEFDVEEASDRTLRQNGAQEVLDRGLPIAESYMYRVHQVPLPKDGERVFRDPQIVGTVTVDREEDVEEGRAPLPPRKRAAPKAPASAAAPQAKAASGGWADQELAA
jgi:phage gp29-like protein